MKVETSAMAPPASRPNAAKSKALKTSKAPKNDKVPGNGNAPNADAPFYAPANYDGRESFDGIFLDLSKESGKCRFADNGFGWKPSGGGDTFTLDGAQIASAQWSRAAKGYEVKILSRNSGIVQLDGFVQEVNSGQTLHCCSILSTAGL